MPIRPRHSQKLDPPSIRCDRANRTQLVHCSHRLFVCIPGCAINALNSALENAGLRIVGDPDAVQSADLVARGLVQLGFDTGREQREKRAARQASERDAPAAQRTSTHYRVSNKCKLHSCKYPPICTRAGMFEHILPITRKIFTVLEFKAPVLLSSAALETRRFGRYVFEH